MYLFNTITKEELKKRQDYLSELSEEDETLYKKHKINKEVMKEFVYFITQRQIITKPILLKNEIECRYCLNIIDYKSKYDLISTATNNHYCRYCGQKLDWSDIQEQIKKERKNERN